MTQGSIRLVANMTNKRDWKWHRDHIATVWGKQVESIFETGQALIDAKAELEHGSFEAMVKMKLPFSEQIAHRVMKITRNPILSKAYHATLLPPSWTILYELSKLPNETLLAKLKDGSIHPKLERKDARAMRHGDTGSNKPIRATRDELIAAIQNDPDANQRDAAAALGVSLGTYQRTRNELIGSGAITRGDETVKTEPPATAVDDLRKQLTAIVQPLSKDERMREVERLMEALGLNIHDWVSTMTLGKKGR